MNRPFFPFDADRIPSCEVMQSVRKGASRLKPPRQERFGWKVLHTVDFPSWKDHKRAFFLHLRTKAFRCSHLYSQTRKPYLASLCMLVWCQRHFLHWTTHNWTLKLKYSLPVGTFCSDVVVWRVQPRKRENVQSHRPRRKDVGLSQCVPSWVHAGARSAGAIKKWSYHHRSLPSQLSISKNVCISWESIRLSGKLC